MSVRWETVLWWEKCKFGIVCGNCTKEKDQGSTDPNTAMEQQTGWCLKRQIVHQIMGKDRWSWSIHFSSTCVALFNCTNRQKTCELFKINCLHWMWSDLQYIHAWVTICFILFFKVRKITFKSSLIDLVSFKHQGYWTRDEIYKCNRCTLCPLCFPELSLINKWKSKTGIRCQVAVL